MPNNQEKKKFGVSISAKSFISTTLIILILMIVSYILTFFIPSGVYSYDSSGLIDPNSFTYVTKDFPFWKFLLSPFLVLFADGGTTIILVIAFLIVIGGIFACLDKCSFMEYLLGRIVSRFSKQRTKLLFIITLFFFSMGAFVGSFEESLPLVPIVVSLAISLGYDDLTGIGMSLVATGIGFATAVINPFTIGVAQTLAGVPMFSGIWLRLVSYVLIYGLLSGFIYLHAKKIAKPVEEASSKAAKEFDPKMNKAVIVFASVLGTGILLILSSTFLTFLQDYTMVIVVLMFLFAGIPAVLICGMKWLDIGKTFLHGVIGVLPAIVMILLASSIKYILTESQTIDTILNYAISLTSSMHPIAIVLFMYLIALIVNFFVPSGSAEAVLLIPLLVPLAQVFNISKQVTILTYVYGDGFSNVLYPTNPALLIGLGLVGVGYGKYFKWIYKLQLAILVLTSLILVFAYSIGY